jgi:hypothetical protein
MEYSPYASRKTDVSSLFTMSGRVRDVAGCSTSSHVKTGASTVASVVATVHTMVSSTSALTAVAGTSSLPCSLQAATTLGHAARGVASSSVSVSTPVPSGSAASPVSVPMSSLDGSDSSSAPQAATRPVRSSDGSSAWLRNRLGVWRILVLRLRSARHVTPPKA